jgi:hypothetical protein
VLVAATPDRALGIVVDSAAAATAEKEPAPRAATAAPKAAALGGGRAAAAAAGLSAPLPQSPRAGKRRTVGGADGVARADDASGAADADAEAAVAQGLSGGSWSSHPKEAGVAGEAEPAPDP